MAINDKKKVTTTVKKVKNYGKEYIQNIQLPTDSQPLKLGFDQLAEKLTNNKRYTTVVSDGVICTQAPTGFWKHNLPENASFVVTEEGFKIDRY